MITIGFVLLTHSHPEQVAALTRVLTELYDSPPIVCHHDFSQCSLDTKNFAQNVRFVEPHFKTHWGCFSIIPAALAAIQLMQDEAAPDWLYLLSGSDYPAAPPDEVKRMLSETQFDAFIDHREISWPTQTANGSRESITGFNRPGYREKAYQRYCAVAVPRPSKAKPFAIPPVGRFHLRHPFWRSLFPGPFSQGFRCYAGEHWFTVNRRAAEVLLKETPNSRRLLTHLRHRESPEECFYHSMLGNSSLRLSRENLRYIDWPSADAWHPKMLTVDDLPAVIESGAHFARKVPAGSAMIPALNNVLGTSANKPLRHMV